MTLYKVRQVPALPWAQDLGKECIKFMKKYSVLSVEKQSEFQNFPIFLIFKSQAESYNKHEGGGLAEDAGRKEVEW